MSRGDPEVGTAGIGLVRFCRGMTQSRVPREVHPGLKLSFLPLFWQGGSWETPALHWVWWGFHLGCSSPVSESWNILGWRDPQGSSAPERPIPGLNHNLGVVTTRLPPTEPISPPSPLGWSLWSPAHIRGRIHPDPAHRDLVAPVPPA